MPDAKRRPLMLILCACLATACHGCATSFDEKHYFQTLNQKGEATNFYRLHVYGGAQFSSARYVSGYYDERAVDLFFDELRLSPTTAENPNTRKLFTQDMEDASIVPLSPNSEHGAFVMVLSSNASAVTNAIGQFSENQIVADAVTNLVNRDEISRTKSTQELLLLDLKNAAAGTEELRQLFALLPQPTDIPNPEATRRGVVRILNAIARLKGFDMRFSGVEEAVTWFEANK